MRAHGINLSSVVPNVGHREHVQLGEVYTTTRTKVDSKAVDR